MRQYKMGSISSSGRFSSREEWQLAVKMRRDAAQPRTTFLQDMLSDLREKHVSASIPLTKVPKGQVTTILKLRRHLA